MAKVTEYMIQKIRKDNSIIDFLSEKGFNPEKDHGDKASYICPFPSHDDTKPSFFVYRTGEYENFYCWGCKKSGDIIEAYKEVNGLRSRWEAIKRLGGDMDISYDEELRCAIDGLDEDYEAAMMAAISMPGKIALNISMLGSQHLAQFRGDQEEYEFLEKLYSTVDKCILQNDMDELLKIYAYLTEKRVTLSDGSETTPFAYRSRVAQEKVRAKQVRALESEI